MTRARLEEMFLESGLDPSDDADLAEVLAPLAELDGPAPSPSTELAALFAGAVPTPATGRFGGPRKRAVAGVVVLALSGVGATGLSAAANTLPRGLQHQVSQFSRHFLPFDLPEPTARPERPADLGIGPRSTGRLPSDQRTPADLRETSRSLSGPTRADDRDSAGAGAPRPVGPSAASGPSAAPSPSSKPSASPTYAPSSTWSPRPSATWSPRPSATPSASPASPSPTKGGYGRPGQGGNPSKGPSASPRPTPRPTPEPGSKPAPRPGKPGPQPLPPPIGDPGDGGSTPTPTPTVPDLPTPTIPLPDLPLLPDLPGTSTDGSDVSGG